jgi:hypothetical protein
MLLGGCLALALTAAPAGAELSSVDAYGGQAQVLGKPVHRHVAPGGSGTQGSGRESGQSAGTTGSGTGGGGSAGSPSGSGSHASTGSSSATPTTPGASNSVAGAGASNAAGDSGGTGGHGGDSGASITRTGGASGATGGGQSPPIALVNSADVSDGSLSLSALDVLLLIVVFAGLAGVGVLMRRWSRQSE